MAFLGILPGREALFQPQPRCPVAVNDAHAWRLNPRCRHVYDRLNLAVSAGLRAAPCGVAPRDYGFAAEDLVFVKPIINLAGMALGTQALAADQVPNTPGSFWCEYLQGEHSSSDCLVEQGQTRWFAHTRASTERHKARPLYWEVGAQLPHLEPILTELVSQHLVNYSGLCNIELIGGQPVEMHLRGSNGFIDFYGPEFVPAWVALTEGRTFQPPAQIPGGFVISVFGDGEPDANLLQAAAAEQVSVQIDRQTADRIAILRCRNLAAGLRVAQALTPEQQSFLS